MLIGRRGAACQRDTMWWRHTDYFQAVSAPVLTRYCSLSGLDVGFSAALSRKYLKKATSQSQLCKAATKSAVRTPAAEDVRSGQT